MDDDDDDDDDEDDDEDDGDDEDDTERADALPDESQSDCDCTCWQMGHTTPDKSCSGVATKRWRQDEHAPAWSPLTPRGAARLFVGRRRFAALFRVNVFSV
jgi:hypothetical protein